MMTAELPTPFLAIVAITGLAILAACNHVRRLRSQGKPTEQEKQTHE